MRRVTGTKADLCIGSRCNALVSCAFDPLSCRDLQDGQEIAEDIDCSEQEVLPAINLEHLAVAEQTVLVQRDGYVNEREGDVAATN